MGYRKTSRFDPPKLKDVKSVEELAERVERWAADLAAKLEAELKNIERGA